MVAAVVFLLRAAAGIKAMAVPDTPSLPTTELVVFDATVVATTGVAIGLDDFLGFLRAGSRDVVLDSPLASPSDGSSFGLPGRRAAAVASFLVGGRSPNRLPYMLCWVMVNSESSGCNGNKAYGCNC